jgi:hypothetical protein
MDFGAHSVCVIEVRQPINRERNFIGVDRFLRRRPVQRPPPGHWDF